MKEKKEGAARRMRWAALTAAVLMLATVFTVSLAGCGSSDPGQEDVEEVENDEGGRLNPPAWLIGKWVRETPNPAEDIVVTAHNVTVSSGNLDFSDQIEHDYVSNFKETLGDNLYTLSYTSKNPAGQNISYTFKPKEGGKMECILFMFGMETSFIYVKK